jgi:1-acyl-sn-glycerol-3-phosphate acyltransferase
VECDKFKLRGVVLFALRMDIVTSFQIITKSLKTKTTSKVVLIANHLNYIDNTV